MAGLSVTHGGSAAPLAEDCWMRLNDGPQSMAGNQTKLAEHDVGLVGKLSSRALARSCRDHHDRARHLAHNAPPAHLLARGARGRFSLPRSLLPCASLLRCASAGVLCCVHPLWLVALVAWIESRWRGARSSAQPARLAHWIGGGCGWRRAAGMADGAHRRGTATS